MVVFCFTRPKLSSNHREGWNYLLHANKGSGTASLIMLAVQNNLTAPEATGSPQSAGRMIISSLNPHEILQVIFPSKIVRLIGNTWHENV